MKTQAESAVELSKRASIPVLVVPPDIQVSDVKDGVWEFRVSIGFGVRGEVIQSGARLFGTVSPDGLMTFSANHPTPEIPSRESSELLAFPVERSVPAASQERGTGSDEADRGQPQCEPAP